MSILTDDKGGEISVFAGFSRGVLAPGPYRIRAAPITGYTKPAAEGGEVHLVAAGGAGTSMALNSNIEVRAGAETSNVTIALKPHAVIRISGSVTGAAGAADAIVKVTHLPR